MLQGGANGRFQGDLWKSHLRPGSGKNEEGAHARKKREKKESQKRPRDHVDVARPNGFSKTDICVGILGVGKMKKMPKNAATPGDKK